MAATLHELPFDLGALGGSVRVTQGWGGSDSHYGTLYYSLDFAVPAGTRIYAMGNGTIKDLRESVPGGGSSASQGDPSAGPSNIGNFVTVDYDYPNVFVTYQHLATNSVVPTVKQSVKTGDLLGVVGNTGLRDGAHLHMQIGLSSTTYTNGGAGPNSIVADGSKASEPPVAFDTATGRIEAGVVSQVTYDLTRDYLPAGQHNLTLLGSKSINGYGDSSANIISGTSGANRLEGRVGNDTVDGGAGNDTIIGGAGADRLTGGAGKDLFVFQALTDSPVGSGRDIITDWSSGDRIDVSALYSKVFKYIGSQSLHGIAGELRFSGGILEGDVDGNGKADFQIQLTGVSSMSASDFIL